MSTNGTNYTRLRWKLQNNGQNTRYWQASISFSAVEADIYIDIYFLFQSHVASIPWWVRTIIIGEVISLCIYSKKYAKFGKSQRIQRILLIGEYWRFKENLPLTIENPVFRPQLERNMKQTRTTVSGMQFLAWPIGDTTKYGWWEFCLGRGRFCQNEYSIYYS